MDLLTMISLICGILMFVGSFMGFVFKVMIIQPLKTAIDNLAKTVQDMLKDIEASRVDRYNLNIKLTSIESELKHLSSRIDNIEEEHKGR